MMESITLEKRKRFNQFVSDAKDKAKPNACALCKKPQTSFCNSHSIPKMVLRSIADKGMVMQANAVSGFDAIDTEKGVKNSGTFQLICHSCDNTYFQDYENYDNLKSMPTNKMMAEIALKDAIIQLWKSNVCNELYTKTQEITGALKNVDIIYAIKDLDIKEYTDQVSFYQSIIDRNSEDEFHLLYWKLLPYKTPIAVQSLLALPNDINGNQINDIFNLSENVRLEYLHICVFPLESETSVFMFYHKRDSKYASLQHQLDLFSDDEKLAYINWLVFKYTENYFISRSIKELIESDEKLQELSQESGGFPNFGMVDEKTILGGYESIKIQDIPNILSEECALK